MPSVKNLKEDTLGIYKIVNEEKTKMNMFIFFKRDPKTCRRGLFMQWLDFLVFRERRCAFSLGFWSIGPLVFDGARRKVALCGEDYAWVPIWWSSDNSKR